MRRLLFLTAAGLGVALAGQPGRASELNGTDPQTGRTPPARRVVKPAPVAAEPAGAKDSCHGTAIEFADTPKEAAAQAKKEEKLVLVLHVSGHFEDPRFT